MKRSWVVLPAVALLSGLAGVAIAGRPYPVDTTVVVAPTPTLVAAETTTTGAETSTTIRPAASPSTSSSPSVTVGRVTLPSTSSSPSTTVGRVALPSPSSSPSTTSSSPTTTVAASLDRSAMRVLVANATHRPGIARSTSHVLIAAGFTDSKPIDALKTSTVTVVYVRPGSEAGAADLASTLGLAAATVQPLGTTAITTRDSNADLIVAIGGDFQS